MDVQFYQNALFLLITLLFYLYAVLDGFDLGVGMLLPFTRSKAEAERLVSYIAPFWDGNEVWLVIAVGFVFAAFPGVLGLLLGAFYLPFMLLIAGFILRAIALEYSYHDLSRQRMWHIIAACGSYLVTALALFVLGSILNGVPFTGPGTLSYNAVDYIAPFPVIFTITGLIFVMWHGAAYALTHDPSEARQTSTCRLWPLLAGAGILLTATWIFALPQAVNNPATAAGLVLCITGIIGGRIMLKNKSWAFRLSCLNVTGLWLLITAALHPNALPARLHPEWSISIASAATPLSTLKLMLNVGLVLVPVILAYSYFTYRALRLPTNNKSSNTHTTENGK